MDPCPHQVLSIRAQHAPVSHHSQHRCSLPANTKQCGPAGLSASQNQRIPVVIAESCGDRAPFHARGRSLSSFLPPICHVKSQALHLKGRRPSTEKTLPNDSQLGLALTNTMNLESLFFRGHSAFSVVLSLHVTHSQWNHVLCSLSTIRTSLSDRIS